MLPSAWLAVGTVNFVPSLLTVGAVTSTVTLFVRFVFGFPTLSVAVNVYVYVPSAEGVFVYVQLPSAAGVTEVPFPLSSFLLI